MEKYNDCNNDDVSYQMITKVEFYIKMWYNISIKINFVSKVNTFDV